MLDAWFDIEDRENDAVQEILESTIRGNRLFLKRAMRSGGRTMELTPEEFERELVAFRCDSIAGDISDVLGVEAPTGKLRHGLRRELRNQLKECLHQLDVARAEEERPDRIAAVKGSLNLDVYQYIHCIIQITKRNAGKLWEPSTNSDTSGF